MKLLNNVFTQIFLTIGLFCQTIEPCYAQIPEFEWAAHLGATMSQSGHAITTDSSGNSYSNGILNSELTVLTAQGPFTLQSSIINSPFVVGTTDQGVHDWASNIEVAIFTNVETEKCIAHDPQGYSYFAATVSSFENWDIIPGPDSLVISLYADALIAKFSSSGEIIWVKAIGDNIGLSQEPHDIAVDSEGNVYTCGWFDGSPDFDPGPDTLIMEANESGSGFIHKMDADGNLLWAGMPGEYGLVNGIAIDEWDNVYITGEYNDTVDIAPGPDTLMISGVTGNIEAYVLKLNPDGLTEWVTGIGGSGGERANSIALSPNGSILVCGTFTDTVNSYPLLLNEPLQTAGDEDIFIWELDSDGNSLNAHQIGGVETDGGSFNNPTTSIKTDPLGNIYLFGTVNHWNELLNTDLDPGPDTTWSQDLGITYDFIAKYDPDMNLIWAMPGNGAADFAVGSGQQIYITGSFTDTIDLDPGPVQQLYISEGGSDMYVLKLNQDSLLTSEVENETLEFGNGLKVTVWPNPSNGNYNIQLNGAADNSYRLMDLTGKTLLTNSFNNASTFNINFEGQAGLYLLELVTAEERTVVRLVKH